MAIGLPAGIGHPGGAPVRAAARLAGVRFLLHDQFGTGYPAGALNGTPAEPGPGVRTVDQDTNLVLSIAGGKAITSGNGAGAGNPRLVYPALARAPGLVMAFDFTALNTGNFDSWVGWAGTATPGSPLAAGNFGVGLLSTTTYPIYHARSGTYGSWPPIIPGSSPPSRFAIVVFAVGYALYAQIDGAWRRVWAADESVLNPDPIYPAWAHSPGGGQRALDNVVVSQITGDAWTTFTGFSTTYRTTFPMTAPDPMTADATLYWRYTLPAPPTAGNRMELRYRIQDAMNYWVAYMEYTGTQWNFKLDSVSGGVATNRVTVNNVSATTGMAVQCVDTRHQLYKRTANQEMRGVGSLVNVSHLDTQTGVQTFAAAGATEISLRADVYRTSAFDLLNGYWS